MSAEASKSFFMSGLHFGAKMFRIWARTASGTLNHKRAGQTEKRTPLRRQIFLPNVSEVVKLARIGRRDEICLFELLAK
jgi:hypothetical protein